MMQFQYFQLEYFFFIESFCTSSENTWQLWERGIIFIPTFDQHLVANTKACKFRGGWSTFSLLLPLVLQNTAQSKISPWQYTYARTHCQCYYFPAVALMMVFLTSHKTGQLGSATSKYLLAVQSTSRTDAAEFSAEEKTIKNPSAFLSALMFSKLLYMQRVPHRRFYLADVLWCLIGLTAELTTYLEVTDAGNRVSQLGELLAAQYKHCLIRFVIFML